MNTKLLKKTYDATQFTLHSVHVSGKKNKKIAQWTPNSLSLAASYCQYWQGVKTV